MREIDCRARGDPQNESEDKDEEEDEEVMEDVEVEVVEAGDGTEGETPAVSRIVAETVGIVSLHESDSFGGGVGAAGDM